MNDPTAPTPASSDDIISGMRAALAMHERQAVHHANEAAKLRRMLDAAAPAPPTLPLPFMPEDGQRDPLSWLTPLLPPYARPSWSPSVG